MSWTESCNQAIHMTENVDINPKLSFYLAHLFVPSRTN